MNDAPLAVDDAFTIGESEVLFDNVLTNDTDPDGDALQITSADGQDVGTVINTTSMNGRTEVAILAPSGALNIAFDPLSNFEDLAVGETDTVTITYTISDGNGEFDTANVVITVQGENDAPVAVDDAATTNEDTAVAISVLANDTDVDADGLTVTSASDGANGTTMVNPDGTITYTPNGDFNGSDSFIYEVSDGNGGTASATVNVTVNPVNDAPVAADDSATTDEDTAIVVAVLGNDSDPDGDAVSVTGASDGANGVTTVNPDGTITYTPNGDFNGQDSFTYEVSDSNGGIASATVTVTVNPVNDAPTALDDIFFIQVEQLGGSFEIDVTANDFDPDGDPLSVIAVDEAALGVAEVSMDGTKVVYTPDPRTFDGSDVFSYAISDGNGFTTGANVTVVFNEAPILSNDAITISEKDVDLTFNIFDNDFDNDGDELTLVGIVHSSDLSVPFFGGVGVLQPTNTAATLIAAADGTITVSGGGSETREGGDQRFFVATVSDGKGGISTSLIDYRILPADDPAVFGGTLMGAVMEGALDNSGQLSTSGQATVTDPDAFANTQTGLLSFRAETVAGTYGALTIAADGSWSYSADPTQQVIQALQVGQSLTDKITIAQGPALGFGGVELGGATTDITITINGANTPPNAGPLTFTSPEDTTLQGVLVTVDSDPEGEAVTAARLTDPTNGQLTSFDEQTGAFVYEPNANFFGQDSFTYSLTDASGATSAGTVTLNIESVPDAPVAGDDTVVVQLDTATALSVLDNDSDGDGDPLTITAVTAGSNGTTAIQQDNTILYTPNPGFTGADSFTYTLSDGTGRTDTATVSVTVNNPPNASLDDITVFENVGLATINVLANDSDPNGDPLTVIAFGEGLIERNANIDNVGEDVSFTVSDISDSSIRIEEDGTLTVTLNDPELFNNPALSRFVYIVSDGQGGTDLGSVNFLVRPVNDPAVFGGDLIGAVTEDIATPAGNLVASGQAQVITDKDDPSDFSGILGFQAATVAGTYGALSIDANGNWTYTADNSQSAIQSLAAGEALTDTITVTQALSQFSGDIEIGGDTTEIVITINGVDEVGSAGAEVLLGTSAAEALDGLAGNDVLNGLGGDDTLTGGADADTFIFQDGAGVDTVTDFTQGEDVLDVSDFTALVASFQADFAFTLIAATQVVGDDLRVTLDSDDAFLIQNGARTILTASDFAL